MSQDEDPLKNALQGLANGYLNASALGAGALTVALHTVRVLANRGLISPNEVEAIYLALTETIERLGTVEFESSSAGEAGKMFAEIRQCARERWIGKGKPDPEPRPGRSG